MWSVRSGHGRSVGWSGPTRPNNRFVVWTGPDRGPNQMLSVRSDPVSVGPSVGLVRSGHLLGLNLLNVLEVIL